MSLGHGCMVVCVESKQAGKLAGWQTGRPTDKQTSRQAGKQARRQARVRQAASKNRRPEQPNQTEQARAPGHAARQAGNKQASVAVQAREAVQAS